MIYKELVTLFLCLVFVGQTLAQNAAKTNVKKTDVAPELQEKAVALLISLAREAEQFSLPFNRISARIEIGELLWERNEKQARTVFQNAVLELNSMISQIPPVNEDEEENTERYRILTDAKTLRNDLLIALGSRDPKLALDALQILSRKDEFSVSLFEDDKSLELGLAAQIAEKDPKQAYEMAKKNLENSIDSNLFPTLESLYKKDAELGAKLAQDIAAKLKIKDTAAAPSTGNSSSNRMMSNGSAMISGMTNSATMTRGNQIASYTVNTWDIQAFLESIRKINRQAATNKKPNVLTENELREIIDNLAQKYVSQQYLSAYEVMKAMPEITKYFPAQAQAIQRRIGQQQTEVLGNLMSAESFQNEIADKSADEISQIIEKKSAAERDNLYYKAAEAAHNAGDFEEAKKFHGKIKTKPDSDYLEKSIESSMPLVLAEKGELREVRRMLAKLKTPEERIEILSALAGSIAKKGDKKTAAALAGEARSMYSGKMKNRKNLASILQIAQAYAVVDAEQGFAFLENNTSFFNDLISAGILLDEFNDYGSVENEEVRLDTVRGESYRNLSKGVALIKSLSAADFDRTTALAERFSRAEVRFYARFRIAEALLNPNAEAEEKQFQSNIENEHGDM